MKRLALWLRTLRVYKATYGNKNIRPCYPFLRSYDVLTDYDKHWMNEKVICFVAEFNSEILHGTVIGKSRRKDSAYWDFRAEGVWYWVRLEDQSIREIPRSRMDFIDNYIFKTSRFLNEHVERIGSPGFSLESYRSLQDSIMQARKYLIVTEKGVIIKE